MSACILVYLNSDIRTRLSVFANMYPQMRIQTTCDPVKLKAGTGYSTIICVMLE